MKIPLALGVGDGFSLAEIVELAVFCDNNGYDSVWIPEDRLVRDAIVPTALSAYATRRVKLGTGVVNNRTRNAALMAVTFKTLFEVAPGRINLGIGAWWEPIASRVGTPLNQPLLMMREYIHALKTLFRGETLNFEGEFVRMHDVSFDMLLAGNRHMEPVPIPVYIGATGPRMLELAGELADGALLNLLVPPDYIREAVAHVRDGIARRKDGVDRIDLPQMVACCLNDDDPQSAIDTCKRFLLKYLRQEPHVAEHSGIDHQLVERIRSQMSWTPTEAELQDALPLISNPTVQNLAACGSTSAVLEQVQRFLGAGSTSAVLCILGHQEETLRRLGRAAS